MLTPSGHVTLFIDAENCRACSRCLARQVCKVKAIVHIDREEPPFIDMHRCHGCRLCMTNCPFEAVKTTI